MLGLYFKFLKVGSTALIWLHRRFPECAPEPPAFKTWPQPFYHAPAPQQLHCLTQRKSKRDTLRQSKLRNSISKVLSKRAIRVLAARVTAVPCLKDVCKSRVLLDGTHTGFGLTINHNESKLDLLLRWVHAIETTDMFILEVGEEVKANTPELEDHKLGWFYDNSLVLCCEWIIIVNGIIATLFLLCVTS